MDAFVIHIDAIKVLPADQGLLVVTGGDAARLYGYACRAGIAKFDSG
jgi:hypothetical protein